MTDRFLVGTRKGLFSFVRTGRQIWEIARHDFPGVNVSMALSDDRTGNLYAALAHGHFGCKLHRSTDGGRNWQELPAPSFPKESENEQAPSVELIWELAAAGRDAPGVIWAGTIPGGLFRSDDAGDSWQLNHALWERPERQQWFGGGYDKPGIHSICVDPRTSDSLTVAVSCGGVWHSQNGGALWEPRTTGIYAAYMPPELRDEAAIQDPHSMVQCPANPDTLWIQHHNGVFRSTDRGRHWQEIDAAVSRFGFAVAVHPADAATAWLVPAISDEVRHAVDGRLRVTRTRDGGASFQIFERGLPESHAYDLVYRHGLAVDETGQCLFMGSTTGNLWMSEDAGESWTTLSGHLPPINCIRPA
jgi:photosystem II stability/assembly factor-like uncharacterized protein